MSLIQIQPTATTPYVLIDEKNSRIVLSGKSSPADSISFYHPLIDQAKTFFSGATRPLEVEMKFRYFNTSTSKCLFDLFRMLKGLKDQGKDVIINWQYEDDDEDMMETGEDYAEILEMEFNFIAIADLREV